MKNKHELEVRLDCFRISCIFLYFSGYLSLIVPHLHFLALSWIFVYISVYFCIFLYNLGVATFSLIIRDFCVFFEYVRKTREKQIYYVCKVCRKQRTFLKDSAVCKNWRCGVQVMVWMIWYFLQKYSRSHIYRLLGGDLPEPHGCPINIHTIGLYIRDMTERVGAVGFRKLLTYRLSGKVQVDESFVRTPRKHNVGRIVRNRPYTLVINSCVGPQVLCS